MAKSTRPRLKDVARLAGVSSATASIVLSQRPSAAAISEETRARVRTAAEELGYQPNAVARSLRARSTQMIGAWVSDVTNPFLAKLISEIERELAAKQYRLLLVTHANGSDHSPQDADFKATLTRGGLVDGNIIIGPLDDLQVGGEPAGWLASSPAVIVGTETPNKRLPVVHIDNNHGMKSLLRHFHGLGHRRLACVSGSNTPDMKRRLEAFQEGIERIGATGIVAEAQDSYDGGYLAAHRIMQNHPDTTGILACSDVMAAGAVRALRDDGFSVPRDVSVSGFDDIDISHLFIPTLTTVRQPTRVLASKACAVLVQQLADAAAHVDSETVIKAELVLRESTAQARTDSTKDTQ